MESNLRNRLSIALDLIDRQLTPGFYRGKPYQAPDVVVPQDIQIPEHKVQKKYLDYLKMDWQRKKAGKASKKPPVRPYGQFGQQIAETGKTKTLAIAGPANWRQLWTTSDSVGMDLLDDMGSTVYGLSDLHLNYLQSSLDSSELLNNIEFEAVLGQGGFAQVCRVRAMQLDRNTNERNPQKSDLELEIFGDMLALRYLNHPNICNLVDVIGIPDSITRFPFSIYCLFMELCSGDLSELVANSEDQRLSEPQNRHWFRHIIEAVVYLHKQHVVHQDIKTTNIFYKSDNSSTDLVFSSTFKLGDFGSSFSFTPDQVRHEENRVIRNKNCDISQLAMALLECIDEELRFRIDDYEHKSDSVFAQECQISKDLVKFVKQLIFSFPKLTAEQVMANEWLIIS